jgi:hypothetical protein
MSTSQPRALNGSFTSTIAVSPFYESANGGSAAGQWEGVERLSRIGEGCFEQR